MGLKKHAWSICILVALSCATHWQWVFLSGIFTDGDFWYQPNQYFLETFTVPKILNITTTMGAGTATPTFAFLFIFGGLLAHIHLYFSAWERIVFLWPITFLGPIPMYVFLYRLFRYKYAAVIGAMIYSLNSYVISREISHLNIAIAFLCTPFLIIVFENLLKKQDKRSIFYFSVTSIIYSIYEARILFISALILIAYGIFLLIAKAITPSWKLFRTALIAICIVTLFQSYWLVPFLFSNSSLGYASITSRGLFPSFAYITHAITISDPFWVNWGAPSNFVSEPVWWWLYLIPISACIWIVLRKQSGHRAPLWFWLVVALAGIFFVKATNQPFPDAYPWLFAHVPGFRLFRDSSKFNLASALGISILAAASLAALRKKAAPIAIVLGIALAAVMINNSLIMMTGKVPVMTTQYPISDQYKAFQHILESDPAFGRSLWFPTEDRFVFISEHHPRLSALTLASNDWAAFVENPNDPISLFDQPIAHALLNFGSFTYIGAPLDSINNIYMWYPRTKNQFIAYIQNVPHLIRIPEMDDSMPVWKNPDAKPLAYIANNTIAAHEDVEHFSGNDPSSDTAFIFEPQLNSATDLLKKVITNEEFNPFLPNFIAIQDGIVTTTQAIAAHTDSLTTSVQGSTSSAATDIFARRIDDSIIIFSRNQEQESPIAKVDNTAQQYALSINDNNLEFYMPPDDTSDRYIGSIRFPQGASQITVYKQAGDNTNILSDPSFEQGTWGTVGDCNNIDASPTDSNGIQATQSSLATSGEHSLELSAHKHIACVQEPIQVPSSATIVLGSIDYKMEGTTPGSMKIVDTATGSKEATSVVFQNTSDWQHKQFSFDSKSDQGLTMYLYQPSDPASDTQIKGLFDSIQLTAYQQIASATFTPSPVNVQASHAFTQNDIQIVAPGVTDTNLIQGMPLTSQSTVSAGDCNNSDHTSVQQNGITSSVASDGALTIQAKKHIACTTFPLSDIDPAYNYLLTTTYKTEKGAAPWISLYPNKDPSAAKVQLPLSSTPETYSAIIEGQYITPDAQLYVYVSADEGPASSTFTSMSLKKIPILPREYITTSAPSLPPLSTTLRIINPETTVVGVEELGTAPRLLVLSNTFNPGWRLFVRTAGTPDTPWFKRILWTTPGVELSSNNHITANAFVNGWVIDPQEVQQKIGTTQHIEFVMEYWPQRFMDIGTAVTALLAILLGLSAMFLSDKSPQSKDNSTGSNTPS